MKRILIFILPILIIVSVVFTVFGVFQARYTQDRLMDDLKRKAKAIDESMELSVKNIFINNDLKSANRLVERFEKRERLQGSVLYNNEGQIIAITQRISDWKEKDKPYIKEILDKKSPRGSVETFNEYSVYSYIMPVLDDEGNSLGLVEVIYDTSYLFNMLTEMWKRISLTLIILICLIALVAFLI
ncbi:MAG: hypothetical protein FJZ12_04635, partial [Candidatus Omnitrophica bacterium]|nr:hypothetical protein [Candidatus Omnitrophota bacterium]